MLDRFCAWALPEPDPEDPNYPWLQHGVDPKLLVVLNLWVAGLYAVAGVAHLLHLI